MTLGTDGQTPHDFWEARYAAQSGASSGTPTHTLPRFVRGRGPGDALDLGCARGDDAVWLALQGWRVRAVDISESALDHSSANAERNGVADRITFERHDLAESFPAGRFDLVTASFLQTPFAFPWGRVMARAAEALRPGGLLLGVTHLTQPPWSDHHQDDLPDAEALMASVDLDERLWARVFTGPVERTATRASGETAPVLDAVVALERRLDATHAPENAR